ncbi:hypothetical protein Y888_04655 [Mixta calida B021323]|nr:hypothetical protein Y888_04655 [Mixta calida B021323]
MINKMTAEATDILHFFLQVILKQISFFKYQRRRETAEKAYYVRDKRSGRSALTLY